MFGDRSSEGCSGCIFVGIILLAFLSGIVFLNNPHYTDVPRIIGWILVFSPFAVFLLSYIYRRIKSGY
jgi:O-antigen/teichoic acid export membrane protein